MKLQWNRCRIGLALFVVLATGCGRRSDAQDDETGAKMALMRHMMMEQEFGTVIMSGQIVDENGNQLDGVKVTGEYQWMDDETGGLTKIDETLNGLFEFSITNCGVIELEFLKEGYYKAKLDRAASDGEPDWGGRKKLEEHDINIVLEKQGELTVLTGSEVWLEYHVPARVLVGSIGPDGKLSKTEVDDFNVDGALPEHGIYITAETTGSVISVTDETNKYGSVVGINVMNGKLVMCNSEDGFVGQDPTAEVSEEALWKMREAPDLGYVSELPLPPKGDSFFYVKIGSMYGKGFVGTRDVSSETNSFDCILAVKVQKDGSRNLETRY